jgi:RHS repeat-associated protein
MKAGQRFRYDAESRQKEFFAGNNSGSTPDAAYEYDGEGRRVKKVSATETTIFVYDASSQLIAEYSTELATVPQVSYLTTDTVGSARIVTNENGAVTGRKDFGPFGDGTVTAQRTTDLGYTPPNIRQDFTGYQKDEESQLEYAQARYFNPTHGRFTSVDPLTASATIRNPQTFNRYSYGLNSPYKFTDPLGLTSVLNQRYSYSEGPGAGGALSGALASGMGVSLFDSITGGYSPSIGSESTGGRVDQTQDSDLEKSRANLLKQYPEFNSKDQAVVDSAIIFAQAQVNNPSYREDLVNAFRKTGDATDPSNVLDGLKTSGGISIVTVTLGKKALRFNQNVFDGRKSTLDIIDPLTNRPIRAAELFREHREIGAFVTPDGKILLGPKIFNPNTAIGRAKIIIHEAIVHKGFGRRDAEFGRGRGIMAGSDRINRILDQINKSAPH